MAGVLDAIYTVLVVLVAVCGTVAVLWATDSPRSEGSAATGATALAVVVFTVAIGASLL